MEQLINQLTYPVQYLSPFRIFHRGFNNPIDDTSTFFSLLVNNFLSLSLSLCRGWWKPN